MKVFVIQDDVGLLILGVPIKKIFEQESHRSSRHSVRYDHSFLGTVIPLAITHILPGTMRKNIGQMLPLLKDCLIHCDQDDYDYPYSAPRISEPPFGIFFKLCL